MATIDQITANQENAQHSTGPRSEAGKQRSKLNSTKHGFTGQTVVLTEAETEPYRLFTEKHLAQLKPVGVNEDHLAYSIIDSRWRMHQISATEAATYALGQLEHAPKFENHPPQLAEAMARSLTLTEKQKEFALLNRYQARLSKQAAADAAQLVELQRIRKDAELKQFNDAAALFSVAMREKKPFNPQEFGFVWTEDQLVDALNAATTLQLARTPKRFHGLTHDDLPK